MFISLLILKQMDVNQNLPNRERKMQSACLFLLWGGMNNYWLIQSRTKNYSISHKFLICMVCNLLCHNLSNRKPQYPPNSCFYWRKSSKASINLRMNLILFHISLIMPVWYYSSGLCLYSRLPLSAGIYPPPTIYRPWLKMVKYILPHTSLINNLSGLLT